MVDVANRQRAKAGKLSLYKAHLLFRLFLTEILEAMVRNFVNFSLFALTFVDAKS
jgi:hypothetical protein